MQVEKSSVMMQSGKKSLLVKVSLWVSPNNFCYLFNEVWFHVFLASTPWLTSPSVQFWMPTGIMCEEPVGIQHGFSDAEGGNVPCGSKVTYGCYWWGDLKGNSALECTANGTFDHPIPQCVTNCVYLQSSQPIFDFHWVRYNRVQCFLNMYDSCFRSFNCNHSSYRTFSCCCDFGKNWQKVPEIQFPSVLTLKSFLWVVHSLFSNIFYFSTIFRNFASIQVTKSKMQ